MDHKMKIIKYLTLTSLGSLLITAVPLSALALSVPPSSTGTPTGSAETNQTRLTNLKTRGSAEIDRRLTTLAKLTSLISSSPKLSTTEKSTLSTEVNNEISGLNTLKTKLNADTDLARARTDVQSIYSEYRVYALIVPKIHLLNVASAELVNDDKLTTLAGKLQTRITDATKNSSNISLQISLEDMKTKIAAAQGLASGVLTKVDPLQPSDYNSDHAILSGQRDKLQTAHQDNVAAYNDAKTIVNGLK